VNKKSDLDHRQRTWFSPDDGFTLAVPFHLKKEKKKVVSGPNQADTIMQAAAAADPNPTQ
jgi:hypothetical protein